MNMFEEARAIRGTVELCTITQEELAHRLNVSQSYIANKLRLLRFSEGMQRRILEKGLTERHARAILRLEDEGAQAIAVERAAAEKMTVAECECLVDQLAEQEEEMRADEVRKKTVKKLTDYISDLSDALRRCGIRATRVTEENDTEFRITLCVGK